MSSDVKNRILKSNSYISNELEKRVSEVLVKYNWIVYRSAYYKDPETSKYRELDIKANYRYTTESLGSKTYKIIQYDLLLECKTLAGYHILFDSLPTRGAQILGPYNIWAGSDTYENYVKFKKIFFRRELSNKIIDKILKKLSKIQFPNDVASIYDYVIKPPPISSFCSFRETNIGTEKELDNAVVWKTFKELQTVIKSIEHEYFASIESNVLGYVDYYKEVKDPKKIISYYNKALKDWGKADEMDLLHPVLVVNCKLWDVSGNQEIKELKYCRLLINSTTGYNRLWFDIVNVEYMDEYIKYISEHYLKNVIEKNRIII